MKIRKILGIVLMCIGILLVCGLNALPGQFGSSAQEVEYDGNMATRKYDVDVELGEDCSYLITETIQTEMLTPRHGIYRYIPKKGTIKEASGQETPYYAKIKLLDCNTQADTSTENGFFVMRLGEEEELVQGLVTYELSYRLTPCLDDPDFTLAYCNLFPGSWQNEIPAGSTVTVHFPKSFDHDTLSLYYGEYGSTADAREVLDLSWQEDTLTITLKENLALGEGLTMYGDMGEGYFQEIHTVTGYRLAILGTAVCVLLLVVVLFLLFGKDEPVIPSVQFSPPQGLDSAAVGYIIDGSVEDKDIISLILYWADQGYLRIEETKKNNLVLYRTEIPLPEDAPGYARKFYDKLFAENRDKVAVKKLKYKCAETVSLCKSLVKDFVEAKGGLYTASSKVCRGICLFLCLVPMTVFAVNLTILCKISAGQAILCYLNLLLMLGGMALFAWAVDKWHARTQGARLGLVLTGLGLYLAGIGGMFGNYLPLYGSGKVFDFLAPLILCAAAGIVCLVLTGFMKKRTPVCVDWMGRLLGLRDFIETAELDRLKAMAEENPRIFYHILPYAYVFGLSDVFAKKLESLAVPAPEWYSSYSPDYMYWNFYHFNRVMMHNMDSMRENLTMVELSETSGNSGSGGSFGGFSGGGGGGFSGGGFGGGGGGSW